MAMGVPVIAADDGNIRQILKNQVFIDMAKEGELAGAILGLDNKKRDEIGKNGRKTVEEHYDLARLKKRYVEMYSTICGSEISEKPYTFMDKARNNIHNFLCNRGG
jgi:glycosyltransferase involved in cell wall biosynthesis